MSTQQIINVALQILIPTVIIPFVGWMAAYIVKFFKTRVDEGQLKIKNTTINHYIDLAEDAVIKAVLSTSTTFTEALKKDGAFTKEKGIEALNIAKEKAVSTITEEGKKIISEGYGDFDSWLDNTIHSILDKKKNNIPLK
jgi:hypothetical protein